MHHIYEWVNSLPILHIWASSTASFPSLIPSPFVHSWEGRDGKKEKMTDSYGGFPIGISNPFLEAVCLSEKDGNSVEEPRDGLGLLI